jgi:hypothetical protein
VQVLLLLLAFSCQHPYQNVNGKKTGGRVSDKEESASESHLMQQLNLH